MIPSGTSESLAPLRHFHPVPEVRFVTSAELPASVRSLLAHDGDMTSRLARAYGSDIQLQVVQHRMTDTALAREVVLRTSSGEAVEYGAIEIFLQHLEPSVKAATVLQREPFGGILNRLGTGYYSAPSAYFVVHSSNLPFPAFDAVGECFARCNVLRNFEGRELARIVEVLSPLAASLNPVHPARPAFSRSQYDGIYLGANASNCIAAMEASESGKTVLLLDHSILSQPPPEIAAPPPADTSFPDAFGLLLRARRAGVEVHEATLYHALSTTELTATARDGSTHRLRGLIHEA